MPQNAAIFFEPEAYVLDGPKLMGRQSAGNAYLRAAVQGRDGEALAAYTPRRPSAEIFAKLVRELDPKATAHWIPPSRFDLLSAHGTLYVPGPTMADVARLRLRAGPLAYSLCGVTHTTASHGAMDAIASMVSAPLAPWDALIATSRAVHATLTRVIEAERAYFAWRMQSPALPPLPLLPVIPLGVHCGDFVYSERERSEARAALGLGKEDVVALFVGRLSFHAKAHPHAMYVALEAAAKRTGKKVALIQCGWFANESIGNAFKDGARRYAPSVTAIFTDGREAAARKTSWAAADMFVSLSDNVQETFGLAPIEAMAAGIPVVGTDWDGYRDTVRDGIDGYLVPTAMPEPGLGTGYAIAHETEEANYDRYIALVCRTVSVDLGMLAERLTELVSSPEARARMGHAGRQRARADFDWAKIYRRYRELWAELAAIRANARMDRTLEVWAKAAPVSAAMRLDPFAAFAEYPTRHIGPGSRVEKSAGASLAEYKVMTAEFLFGFDAETLPGTDFAGAIFEGLAAGPAIVAELAERLKCDPALLIIAVSILAKMGLVRLS